MILIDPELKSDSPPNPVSAKPSAGPAAAAPGRKSPVAPLRLPSVRTLAQFLTRAQAAVRLRGQVTVLVTSDAAMRDLNRRFRGKDKPTDVLSFPSERVIRGTEIIAGDVAIGAETAIRQSFEQGHSLAVEIKVLMLHGLLHLAGHDHETDAGEMQRRERSLRARLGLPLGLIERSTSPTHSQKARMDGARRDRQDGARGRKATAGPSTRPGTPGLAQDDNAKRASKPKKKSARSLRS
jgi:probable rRNA maturation factor